MIAGMDAVITFTKNPDGPSSLRDTNVLDMLGKIFTEHRKQPVVVWRICFASAMFSPDSGSEIARINFHEPLVASFVPCRVPSPPPGGLGLGSSLMLRIRVFVTNKLTTTPLTSWSTEWFT
jgi:hypothetical protein